MKKFLTLIAIATMALGLGAVSLAQDAGPRAGQLQGKQKGRHGGGGARLMKVQKEILAKLNLTADQKRKVEELDKKTQADVKELMDSGKQDRQQMKQIMEEHRAGMAKILTPEQNRRFREMMLDAMKKMKEEREKRKGTPPPTA